MNTKCGLKNRNLKVERVSEAKIESEKIIALINASPKVKKILEAENWHAIFQLNLEGETKPFFIEIKNGKATLQEGTNPNPTLLITGKGSSIARVCRGQGDFTHSISREEIEIKKGKVMELIRYGRAISAAVKEKKVL